jgi:ribose 5-phosphate isomerase B
MTPAAWQKKALRWFWLARAALCHDDYSGREGVEDDDLNILCLGGRTTGFAIAWDCTKSFLGARFGAADRYRRQLAKVTHLEASTIGDCT